MTSGTGRSLFLLCTDSTKDVATYFVKGRTLGENVRTFVAGEASGVPDATEGGDTRVRERERGREGGVGCGVEGEDWFRASCTPGCWIVAVE